MQMPMAMMKAFAVGAVVLAVPAFASSAELRVLEEAAPASCSCKNAADCTCPKGQCKCKNCGGGERRKMFDSLKGATETTRLPDTARNDDARAGVLI